MFQAVPAQGAWRRQPGSAAPGPPSPRSAAQARLRRDPPCRGGARGRRASGGPSPPLRPAPDPPPRRSTPPPRALGALRRQGHGRGPLGSYAFGVSGTASPACRVASLPPRTRRSHHRNHARSPPITPSPRPSRRYVPPTASRLEAAPEALELLLHSCSLCSRLLLLNRAASLPFFFTFPLSSSPFSVYYRNVYYHYVSPSLSSLFRNLRYAQSLNFLPVYAPSLILLIPTFKLQNPPPISTFPPPWIPKKRSR